MPLIVHREDEKINTCGEYYFRQVEGRYGKQMSNSLQGHALLDTLRCVNFHTPNP